jgi:DNA invertase Pin-like site-specific DNA recombinase
MISTDELAGRAMEAADPIVAEMEIGFIRERQRAGIEAAKKRGAYKGRPATLCHSRIVSLHKQRIGAMFTGSGLQGVGSKVTCFGG